MHKATVVTGYIVKNLVVVFHRAGPPPSYAAQFLAFYASLPYVVSRKSGCHGEIKGLTAQLLAIRNNCIGFYE